MSKNSSIATEKPRMGVLRMARVNCETIYEEEEMPVVKENYDVCIVGAGHAGCEAALACARLGLETILFTISIESVAMMPCNPNIGGSSK